MGAEAARPVILAANVVGTSLMAESARTAANVQPTQSAATVDNAMEECRSQSEDHSLTAPVAAEHLDSFVSAELITARNQRL
jgi:hypothetical protein